MWYRFISNTFTTAIPAWRQKNETQDCEERRAGKYIYIHTFTYMHSHCAYSYTHISTHTHPYLHIHMHTHRHSYIYMFIHTHMHFHIHTHTHKYWAGQKVCLVLSQNKIFFIFFEELCGTLYPLTEQSFLPNTIYSYLHTCIFITHMYTQKYINICTQTHVTQVHTCMHIHIHMHACSFTHAC